MGSEIVLGRDETMAVTAEITQVMTYDEGEGWRFSMPTCPDCNAEMVKTWIECHDHSGWYCGWLCECSFDAKRT